MFWFSIIAIFCILIAVGMGVLFLVSNNELRKRLDRVEMGIATLGTGVSRIEVSGLENKPIIKVFFQDIRILKVHAAPKMRGIALCTLGSVIAGGKDELTSMVVGRQGFWDAQQKELVQGDQKDLLRHFWQARLYVSLTHRLSEEARRLFERYGADIGA